MAEHTKAKPDLSEAWDRVHAIPVYYPRVPRWTFPFFSALFVALCGVMAVILFGVGKIFGGLLFSFVVLVGLYVLYNNVRSWRSARSAGNS